jgi:hypothetical protein
MPEKRLEKTRRAYDDGVIFRSRREMEQFYAARDRDAQAERIRALLARAVSRVVADQRGAK